MANTNETKRTSKRDHENEWTRSEWAFVYESDRTESLIDTCEYLTSEWDGESSLDFSSLTHCTRLA